MFKLNLSRSNIAQRKTKRRYKIEYNITINGEEYFRELHVMAISEADAHAQLRQKFPVEMVNDIIIINTIPLK